MGYKTDNRKPSWEEKREAFRVDDNLPFEVRRIESDPGSSEKIHNADSLTEILTPSQDPGPWFPILWKMIIQLDQKLDRILEKMPIDLMATQTQPVNLSSTGMKIKIKKNFSLEEPLRIKMLLPTVPVKELLLTGKVVRINPLPEGQYEVALHFQELDDTVKKEIIQFTLNQQRKTLATQKLQRGQS